MHKHVFLIGLQDPVQFKEFLATRYLTFELHDNDEEIDAEEDAVFSYGVARFTLRDFLRPLTRDVKLRSDVFPLKREQLDRTNNLDLNTTARKAERTVEHFSPYLVNATYAVITADLAFPIGTFNEKDELKKIEDAKAEAEAAAAAQAAAEGKAGAKKPPSPK